MNLSYPVTIQILKPKRAFQYFLYFFFLVIASSRLLYAQEFPAWNDEVRKYRDLRSYDSAIASKITVLHLPEDYRGRTLPSSVDNSQNIYFPAILDQYMYFACQQYSGITYTYAYERNRLLNRDADLSQNRFPAHYTWTFGNNGDRYTGVSFFYSFRVLEEQGHITSDDYGGDTVAGTVGWINGYDKYYRGMGNRIKAVYAIPTNTEEGVLTLKHYLHDHLNGSATGGVACFSASSNFGSNFVKLPEGTPEAGKDVITAFYPLATHGMTIVGYNDSIRYDLNKDGKYTNDLDITGDGIVDLRDWEIGAYRMANSYSTWWSDKGFCYILYRAMALKYDYPYSGWDPDRGIWNHSVYVVEPDTGYSPLLTMKLKITYNSREKIRVRAGISSDTGSVFPEHILELPFPGFQGGDHVMQGRDDNPDGKTIEMGFDVSPLLSYVNPGETARYFLIVDERDDLDLGRGSVNNCSFIDYTNGIHEMFIPQVDVAVKNNDLTILSVNGEVNFDKVKITTEALPGFDPAQPYQVQMAASGGKGPYQWSLQDAYAKMKKDTVFPQVYQQRLYKDSPTIPYSRIVLPFEFPFCGKEYDTIYINFYGFVAFDNEQLPYPYLTDEEGMIRKSNMICPAFCPNSYYTDTSYGVWIETNPEWTTIRWKTGDASDLQMRNNFALRLYANGQFEFIYGDFYASGPALVSYSGYSCGDETNYDVWTNWVSSQVSNTSYLFKTRPMPPGITLTKAGLLSISALDTTSIYQVPVMVHDRNGIRAFKQFNVSTGLTVSQQVVCNNVNVLRYGFPAHFDLSLRNTGLQTLQNITLKLLTSDNSVTITDSIVSAGSCAPGGEIRIDAAFDFHLRYPMPDQYAVDFVILAEAGAHSWEKSFIQAVSAPDILVSDPLIFDGYDGYLDPGEIADLRIPLRNIGSLHAENLEIQVSLSDPFVTILSGPVQNIEKIPAFSPAEADFRLQADKNAPLAYNAEIVVNITDHQAINIEKSFTIQLGKIPAAVFSLSQNHASAEAMKTSLDSLQVPYESFTEIPYTIEHYGSLFISLGTSGVTHIITQKEAAQLASYLNLGGKIYLEGYGTWYYQSGTVLHPYFKYSAEKVQAYPYPFVKGVAGTLTESMNFRYENYLKYATYSYTPQSPAFEIFTNSELDPGILQIGYDGDDYKTIGSMFEFGSLNDSTLPSTRKTLMRRYLDFFNVAMEGPRPLFHCSANSVCRWHTVDFNDDSFDDVISWQWEFPGGTPSVSSEKDPSVYYIDAGNYDVRLTVSDGIHTRSILKKDFITVNVCAGIQEVKTKPELVVYPNPSHSAIRLQVPGRIPSSAKILIFDMLGRKVMERTGDAGIYGEEIPVDISSLPGGIYIIRLLSGNMNVSAKLIVD